jgi:hypothetical protein
MEATAALGDREDEGRTLVGAGDEGEGVLEAGPVVAAVDAVQVWGAEVAEFAVEAVEIAAVGEFPENSAAGDKDACGEQAGKEGKLEAEGVRPHVPPAGWLRKR